MKVEYYLEVQACLNMIHKVMKQQTTDEQVNFIMMMANIAERTNATDQITIEYQKPKLRLIKND